MMKKRARKTVLLGAVILLAFQQAGCGDLVGYVYFTFKTFKNTGREREREEWKKTMPAYASGLYQAVRKGDIDKAKSIISRNPRAASGATLEKSLLAFAVCNDDQEMVELLVKHGADVKDGGGGHPTPLHFAARRGNVSIARILLGRGAEINAEYYVFQQETPLVYAQKAGKTAMVKFLKSKGASTENIKNKASRAQHFGRTDELRGILDKGFNVNEKWASGTLLHFAAGRGQMDIAKLLVDRGARLDISLGLGTPLHDAAYEGHAEMIIYLIRRGANPNATEWRNYTPLYWASQNGHLKAVRVLLENGADPNLGKSPIREAQRQGHNEVVTLLKQYGAKPPVSTSAAGAR